MTTQSKEGGKQAASPNSEADLRDVHYHDEINRARQPTPLEIQKRKEEKDLKAWAEGTDFKAPPTLGHTETIHLRSDHDNHGDSIMWCGQQFVPSSETLAEVTCTICLKAAKIFGEGAAERLLQLATPQTETPFIDAALREIEAEGGPLPTDWHKRRAGER